MPVVKHEPFFRQHPVFTAEDLAAHLASRGAVGCRGQEALLAYYTKASRVIRVRRGLYAVVPPGAEPESYPVDPYLIAAKLTPDAVLSSHRTRVSWPGLLGLESTDLLRIPADRIPPVPLARVPRRQISRGASPLRDGTL